MAAPAEVAGIPGQEPDVTAMPTGDQVSVVR